MCTKCEYLFKSGVFMKKNDMFMIVGLIAVALCIFIMNIYNKRSGDAVVIYYNNEEYDVISLDEEKIIRVNDTNVVKIENGKVFMESANCPDQICVQQKPVDGSGRDIVCLPNKVVIRVISNRKDVDVVAR